MSSQHVSIIGGGWAGLAAAVAACDAGHRVSLYEASSSLGGRARSLAHTANDLPSALSSNLPLDNGQHILLGAYSATLGLMQRIGLDPNALLLRLPLDVRFANQSGLALPNWPAPWHALWGILNASGWSARDKWSLLKACVAWQINGFTCPATWSVNDLMRHHSMHERVVSELIEPLCLSALNTPMTQASAAVFLRVLHDALMGGPGSSDLLIPKVDLHQLLPQACEAWLSARGAKVHLSHRIRADDLQSKAFTTSPEHTVILATPAWEAARLSTHLNPTWSAQAEALLHLPIATVYVRCHDVGFKGLSRPMVALHSQANRPAQFVFCRTQLTQQNGVVACVISACDAERAVLETQVLQQLQEQLGLQQLKVLQTVVEKRAAFACTPHLQRPVCAVAPHVWACGDYVAGPYPATLEGAVRSGLQVVAQL